MVYWLVVEVHFGVSKAGVVPKKEIVMIDRDPTFVFTFQALSKTASIIFCFYNEEWFVHPWMPVISMCKLVGSPVQTRGLGYVDVYRHTRTYDACPLDRFALIRSIWSSMITAPLHLIKEVRTVTLLNHRSRCCSQPRLHPHSPVLR